jgi:hypothetical protein
VETVVLDMDPTAQTLSSPIQQAPLRPQSEVAVAAVLRVQQLLDRQVDQAAVAVAHLLLRQVDQILLDKEI